ncbi:AAA family ATPase [Terasakiella sp. A23]|uniref:AAA family ATPase n=1 Tax=Terasakiella sp. FCG-A23 TaxID=3080561 RepID=UPI0029550C51|nr:AAA family ATPase [Terasakiella sp. A23]MDV7341591.1 AAA family ATPase [Terasakiella sp. A23]
MLTTYTPSYQPTYYYRFNPYSVPLPANAASVYKRFAVRFYALQNLEKIVMRILPGGYRIGDLYYVEGGIIALNFTFSPCGGHYMEPGEWMSMNGNYGEEIISLYAVVHYKDYETATTELFNALVDTNPNEQIRVTSGFQQELYPLHNQSGNVPFYGWPHQNDYRVINNRDGNPIATVTWLHTSNGEIAEMYLTLLKDKNGPSTFWAPLFLKEPIFYNRDIMEKYTKAAVWISGKVFVAVERERRYLDWIHTALPEGPSDLLRAEISFLQGREIRMELDHAGLENVLKIHKVLSEEHNCSVTYTFENSGVHDFEGICKVASSRNVLVKGLRAEQDKASEQKVLISRPGDQIHGSDIDRKMLLNPFMKEGYLVWLYAPEKSGKSWLAASIAHVVATGKGSIGNWSPEQETGVLLVDGEMLPDELDNIIAQTIRGSGTEYRGPSFSVLCAKSQPAGVINLTDEFWQNEVEKCLKGKKLLILDNLQSLTPDGGARIEALQPWFRRITQKGIAILILDHSNAEGELQGSIAKKRVANVVISMAPKNGGAQRDGQVTIKYDRTRSKNAEPFVLKRVHGEGTVHYELCHDSKTEEAEEIDPRIRKMALVFFAKNDCGMAYAKIEEQYGIPSSTAQNLFKASESLTGAGLVMFKRELERLRSSNQ